MKSQVSWFIYDQKCKVEPSGKKEWSFMAGDGAGHSYEDAIFKSPKMIFREALKWARKEMSAYATIYVLPPS